MKRLQVVLLMIAAGSAVNAQQIMTSSLYDMHGNLHNPASVGASQHATVGASYRTMWDGIDEARKQPFYLVRVISKTPKWDWVVISIMM